VDEGVLHPADHAAAVLVVVRVTAGSVSVPVMVVMMVVVRMVVVMGMIVRVIVIAAHVACPLNLCLVSG
jgi:hypothetical protein